jgi:hypothetical protein
LTLNQIISQLFEVIVMALCPAVSDKHIAAFDITLFAQTLMKGRQE